MSQNKNYYSSRLQQAWAQAAQPPAERPAFTCAACGMPLYSSDTVYETLYPTQALGCQYCCAWGLARQMRTHLLQCPQCGEAITPFTRLLCEKFGAPLACSACANESIAAFASLSDAPPRQAG